ncbi:A/G-specific adenine glycosylase [Pedobacter sp. MC2016-14]|uniref:A/G-specific adenine glycosylase n=1 Tax=Pedobacter sp. MC2016-14 TaxID=2897327 RepID=UPI001E6534B8|nr:A/G-specific adenine glycosylase [Pedobacter sp. MC2016-14]MCD0487442.1 A/G-specific adenine glycosylase [Pedobacter sp. MC2016-14]
MDFQNEIISWYQINKRNLPWRSTKDAYVIWLSEIILQQTRVEQGLPYFNKFLEAYPTVGDFASASETQVLKLWQGLGYYSRGRNMLFTAQQVNDLYDGVFPVQYNELIKLKGVGEYTAAAISSFSSGEIKAVLDGNVFRVLSRYFGVNHPINSSIGKKEFSALAQSLIEGQDASVYNQAIMEFGALQCKPKSPVCGLCPVQSGCYAYQHNQVNQLPVKLKKLIKRNRYFNYFICVEEGRILLNHRGAGDIWQHLYDFPMIETEQEDNLFEAGLVNKVKHKFGANVVIKPIMKVKHLLTHQTIFAEFFGLENYILNFNHDSTFKWVDLSELEELPQPKMITDFLNFYLTK